MVVFDALERVYYDFLAPHKLIPVPNAVKVPDIDYDCLVITGGPDSVNRNKTENMFRTPSSVNAVAQISTTPPLRKKATFRFL